MAILDVEVRLMPESVEEDLEEIKRGVMKALEKDGATGISMREEDVAFGLRAIIVKFSWEEEKDSDLFEKSLAGVPGVSSASTLSANRAFG